MTGLFFIIVGILITASAALIYIVIDNKMTRRKALRKWADDNIQKPVTTGYHVIQDRFYRETACLDNFVLSNPTIREIEHDLDTKSIYALVSKAESKADTALRFKEPVRTILGWEFQERWHSLNLLEYSGKVAGSWVRDGDRWVEFEQTEEEPVEELEVSVEDDDYETVVDASFDYLRKYNVKRVPINGTEFYLSLQEEL